MDLIEAVTPFLAVNVALSDNNINDMAVFAAQHGVALRPHGKAHKLLPVARRQVEAGAVGLTLAKLAEAEAFVSGGIRDVSLNRPQCELI